MRGGHVKVTLKDGKIAFDITTADAGPAKRKAGEKTEVVE